MTNGNSTTLVYLARGDGKENGKACLTGLGWSTNPSILIDNLNTSTTMTTGYAFGSAVSYQTTTGTYNAFRVYPSSGTLTGTFYLYGLAR
jgi:hypothetical protein